MMVWNGRLPGATHVRARPGRALKPWPRFCSETPQPGTTHAGAEAHVVALDEADHHAALVGGGEVDRAAARRVAGAEVLRPLRVDQLARARRGRRRRASARASPPSPPARRRSGRRRRRRASSPRSAGAATSAPSTGSDAEVEVAQDAERDQRGDALPVRRDLVQRVAAVVDARSARPTRAGSAARSRDRHRAAVARARARRSPRRSRRGRTPRPLVSAIARSARAAAGKAKQLADLGRAAARQEGLGPAGLRLQQRRRRGPLLLHDHRHA